MTPTLLKLTSLLELASEVDIKVEKGRNSTCLLITTTNSDVQHVFKIGIKDMDQDDIPRYKLIVEG